MTVHLSPQTQEDDIQFIFMHNPGKGRFTATHIVHVPSLPEN
jgi:hypothetical protein